MQRAWARCRMGRGVNCQSGLRGDMPQRWPRSVGEAVLAICQSGQRARHGRSERPVRASGERGSTFPPIPAPAAHSRQVGSSRWNATPHGRAAHRLDASRRRRLNSLCDNQLQPTCCDTTAARAGFWAPVGMIVATSAAEGQSPADFLRDSMMDASAQWARPYGPLRDLSATQLI